MLLLATGGIFYNHADILKKFLECIKFVHELMVSHIYIPLPEMPQTDLLFMRQIESHSFLPSFNPQSILWKITSCQDYNLIYHSFNIH